MTEHARFHHVEHILANNARPDADEIYFPSHRLGYQRVVRNTSPATTISALIDSVDSQRFRQPYENAVNTPGEMGAGLIRLHDYSFFEICGLAYDVYHQHALIGEPVFWGSDFAQWYCDVHKAADSLFFGGRYRDISTFNNKSKTAFVRGEHVIISAPGQDIYGHWLLDIIPKLHLLRLSGLNSGSIYMGQVPKWAQGFLQAFEINPNRVKPHPARLFRVEEAIIPTSAKSGFRLGAETMIPAWRHLLSNFPVESPPRETLGAKLFFTRAQLQDKNRRSAPNQAAIEAAFVRRGYTVVAPEKLSIGQQIGLMQNVRILVGEDGSALHNVIYCNHHMRLGVLSLPERNNLWHLGICQLLGHKVGFFDLPPTPEQDVDINKLNHFIDELEN